MLGNQDGCTFYTEDGRQGQGVCCTNPISPAGDGTEQNKVDLPPQNVQHIGSWPPPIPTHPPDHTAATHPPSLFDPVTTQRPARPTRPTTTTTRRTTTWGTKPTQPIFGFPPKTTTKRPFFTTTTESPIINEVEFDGGSCGAKNGFQDQERIVGGQNADPHEWPW